MAKHDGYTRQGQTAILSANAIWIRDTRKMELNTDWSWVADTKFDVVTVTCYLFLLYGVKWIQKLIRSQKWVLNHPWSAAVRGPNFSGGLSKGKIVQIVGLKTDQGLNGQIGSIISLHTDKDNTKRVVVQLQTQSRSGGGDIQTKYRQVSVRIQNVLLFGL